MAAACCLHAAPAGDEACWRHYTKQYAHQVQVEFKIKRRVGSRQALLSCRTHLTHSAAASASLVSGRQRLTGKRITGWQRSIPQNGKHTVEGLFVQPRARALRQHRQIEKGLHRAVCCFRGLCACSTLTRENFMRSQSIRFGQVVAHEHKVQIGGCGVPDEGGYPLSMSNEVVRRSVSELPPHDGTGVSHPPARAVAAVCSLSCASPPPPLARRCSRHRFRRQCRQQVRGVGCVA